MSEWADANRIISSVEGGERGPYRTSRTPYLREIADALSATSRIRRTIVMKAGQLGLTTLGTNWIGYVIDQVPGSMLMVQATGETARRVSKQRIAPMIEACTALREKVKDPRSRDSGNTLLIKEFPGGVLIMTGANSAAGLKSMPIRYLFLDEIDEYPWDVEEQGDPIELVEVRQNSFARAKTFAISTPTIKGSSRIETLFLRSDQRRYFVASPDCGHRDHITWERIRWDKGRPETAALLCLRCGVLIPERHKTALLAGGLWQPTAAETWDGETRGYHLNALYAPPGLGPSWAACAKKFLKDRKDPQKFKTFWNTNLGLPWEERGQGAEPEGIMARVERYDLGNRPGAEVPAGVGVLTGSVDVHGDRVEAHIKGWGAAEESWLIAFNQEFGDPALDEVWLQLDKFLWRPFLHASGRQIWVSCVTVDSGGHHSEQVYRYCKARFARHCFAVRGGREQSKPLVARPTTNNRYRANLFTLCVDTGKETVYARLRIGSPGPGYMHLPHWVDREYIEQLAAEKGIRKSVAGGTIREWVQLRERNEALDLEVYSLAALYILGEAVIRDLPILAAQAALPLEEKPAPTPQVSLRQTGGWVDAWRE